MGLKGLDHVFDLVRSHGPQYSQNVTQAEVIIAAVVLLVLLACASVLDRKDDSDEDRDSLAVWSEDMFDEGDDVLDRHEAEEADDD